MWAESPPTTSELTRTIRHMSKMTNIHFPTLAERLAEREADDLATTRALRRWARDLSLDLPYVTPADVVRAIGTPRPGK